MQPFLKQMLPLFVLLSLEGHGQDSSNVYSFNFNNLRPIVQVFGTAGYQFNQNQYDFSIGRAHLGFEYQFNEKWSSKIIIDRGRPTSISDLRITDTEGNQLYIDWNYSEGAYYTMFLKFASLKFKVTKHLSIEGGAILQNHYITQERFWGLRYVAQTFQDLYWKIPSTDLGFIAYYTFNEHFSVDAAITNGEGPRIAQDDAGNVKVAGGINLNPGNGKVFSRIYYHYRQVGTEDANAEEQMASVFAGIKPMPQLKIGGEFNYMNNFQGISGFESYGYSLYTMWAINTKTEIFIRFDRILYTLPDKLKSTSFNCGNTYMAGISYHPVNGVSASINFQDQVPDHAIDNSQPSLNLSLEYKL